MQFSNRFSFLTAAALLFVSQLALAQSLDDLKWMEGSWKSESAAGVYENSFSSPAGGLILGISKQITPAQTIAFYEYDEIRQTDSGIVLSPKPSSLLAGKVAATFTATTVETNRVVFENPQHAFPSKITYHLDANGQMVLDVDGTQGGQPVHFEVTMKKL